MVGAPPGTRIGLDRGFAARLGAGGALRYGGVQTFPSVVDQSASVRLCGEAPGAAEHSGE